VKDNSAPLAAEIANGVCYVGRRREEDETPG
jgi:hypothetical protein